MEFSFESHEDKPKIKKELVIHNISNDQENYEKYKDKTNILFNDPNFYFSTKHEGNNIVFGKKLSKIKFHNNIPLFKTKAQKKSVMLKNRLTSIKSSTGMSISSKINYNNNNTNLNNNQKYIGNEELKNIYESFKRIELKNLPLSNSAKNLLKDEDYEMKSKLSKNFDLQEKALKNYLSENKNKNNIISKIMRITKKDKKDILMNISNVYRIKKEFINYIDEEDKILNPNQIFGWFTSLRYSENGDLKYYVNVGNKNENWQLFPLKPFKKESEIIRNPSLDKSIYNCKSLKSYFNNNYLEKKFPRSYSYFKSWNNEDHKINKIKVRRNEKRNEILYDNHENKTDFQNLCINGENLLSFEFENSKLLQGKKILNTCNDNINENNNFTISESITFPMIKSSSSNSNL